MENAFLSNGFAEEFSDFTWYEHKRECNMNEKSTSLCWSSQHSLTCLLPAGSHAVQFGAFCKEMEEATKFEFMLDVIRYRVSSFDTFVAGTEDFGGLGKV